VGYGPRDETDEIYGLGDAECQLSAKPWGKVYCLMSLVRFTWIDPLDVVALE
jgi:hypothetical protein